MADLGKDPRAHTAAEERLETAMLRYSRGDASGFAELYDRAAPAIFAFLLRLTRQRALAEDLTHDTFLRVHGARTMYREGARVLPWMYAIARRLFLDSLRSRKREGPSLDAAPDEGGAQVPMVSGDPSAEELLGVSRLETRIEAVLQRLPEKQATAFRLLKQEGLSLADAAAVLGVTEGSVKLRAHRAYEALREELGGDWDLPSRETREARETRGTGHVRQGGHGAETIPQVERDQTGGLGVTSSTGSEKLGGKGA